MNTGIVIMLIIGVLILILFLYVVMNYNSLVKLRNMVKDGWAQVDVHLKRRVDLIPNLVETVKGYASHEQETLEAVIAARNKAVSATTPQAEMESNAQLTQALSKFFALAEAYPELKANTNFIELQKTLKETEDKIGFARQFYNDTVLKYQNKREMFPSNIVASMFGFQKEPFFEVTNEEREVPQVKF